MLNQKNLTWRREMRHWQIEQLKRTQRERITMLAGLNAQLSLFPLCSLFNGGTEQLNHHCFLDCQAFAVEINRTMFRLIGGVGTQNCRQALLDSNFPSVLYALTDTIENKTIDNNKEEEARHFYSRSRVLESVVDLVCLLTEDHKLVQGFGQYAVSMLVEAIRLRSPLIAGSSTWRNPMIGLLNLFLYKDFEQVVYKELHQSNFEMILRTYWYKVIDGKLPLGQEESTLMNLFRVYLMYQENTEDTQHPSTLNSLQRLLHYLFSFENRQYLEQVDRNFIEELLKTLTYFTFPSQTAILVLKCPFITSFLSYIQLFNIWTYERNTICLKDFNQDQLAELLSMHNVAEEESERYGECVAGTMVNLLLNSKDQQLTVEKVHRCLEWAGIMEEFASRTEQVFVQLFRLLVMHSSEQTLV